jgi:sarcosine oxidase
MESAGVWFEEIDAAEIIHRFPQFSLPDDMVGFFQTDYGLIAADRTVSTLASQSRLHGARILESEPVRELHASADGVDVRTQNGNYRAERLVLAGGAWMGQLTRQLGLDLPLTVTKELSTYYRPADRNAFMPGRFPIFRHHLAGRGARWGVGFPIFEHEGVKMVMDCAGLVINPDDPNRAPEAAQEEEARAYVAGILPKLGQDIIEAETCLYTMTPDEHFIMDCHPDFPHIVIASPCSGAGFKFAPLIGRILADLAMNGATHYNIERFRLARAGLKSGQN